MFGLFMCMYACVHACVLLCVHKLKERKTHVCTQ